MASDRQRYNQALQNWHAMHKSAEFSKAPEDNGIIAVLASRGSDIIDGEVVNFAHEALDFGTAYENNGRRVQVRTKVDLTDLTDVIQDRHVSDVILIGHGKLPFFAPFDEKGNFLKYRWDHVASDATHLKLGKVIQRFCGIYSPGLNVPMGALAVSSHTNVFATPGESFAPTGIRDEANQALRSVTDKPVLSYRDIRSQFPSAELIIDSEDPFSMMQ